MGLENLVCNRLLFFDLPLFVADVSLGRPLEPRIPLELAFSFEDKGSGADMDCPVRKDQVRIFLSSPAAKTKLDVGLTKKPYDSDEY